MASIQRRVWIDKDGKQRTSYRAQIRKRGFPPVTATFDRKIDADQWAKETESDMGRRRYFPQHEAERHTLADLVERQLAVVKMDRPQAYGQQSGMLGWWKDKLGAYTLATITPDLIGRHRDQLQTKEGFAPATVNRYLSALSKAFSNAVKEWHWLPDNPMRRVSKKTEPRGVVRYLSDEERAALLKACRESELKPLYLLVLFALTTGMRRGELLGLRWQDIDLERRMAVLQNTKNGDRRSVPIVPEVADLLREHGKVRRLDNDLVFASAGDDAIWFDKYWYRALKVAKIKDFRFHDLRHTAASYLAMSGATTPEIAAVLGHRTLQMVKRYAHLSDQHTGTVVERMTKKYFAP
jgi:integrase